MTPSEEDIAVLLAKWAVPGSDDGREATLFALLPEKKRRLVDRRLRILGPFMEAKAKGEGRPDDAAAALGITVRSLHRLVGRITEMGPVAALAPTSGAGRKRRSDAEATLSEAVQKELLSEVQRYPNQSMGLLISKMKELDASVSASTIRRRAMMLRRELDPSRDARFGRAWLLDQAALSIPVAEADGLRWLTCAFLIDVDTGIICGRAPTAGQKDPGFGALLHGLSRMAMLLPTKLKFASQLEEVTWAVPDGWLSTGQKVVDKAGSMRPPVRPAVLMAGKFRRGSKLSALLGGAIGVSDILIRPTVDPSLKETPQGLAPFDPAGALAYLDQDIVFANREMSKWAKPWGAEREPPSRSRVVALNRLMRRMIDFFEPALSSEQLEQALRLLPHHDAGGSDGSGAAAT